MFLVCIEIFKLLHLNRFIEFILCFEKIKKRNHQNLIGCKIISATIYMQEFVEHNSIGGDFSSTRNTLDPGTFNSFKEGSDVHIAVFWGLI